MCLLLHAVLLVTSLVACDAACDADDVAVYHVTLNTNWTEQRFPKNYPQYRPGAQWAQVFGQSHNASHRLYHIGEVSSAELRQYAVTGSIADLVELSDDDQNVYDQFAAAAIPRGLGSAENVFFVDGGHSLVSLVARLVPSPDWFVGVDSLQLCAESLWVDEVSVPLDPLDAGAASGLSFTSPHWQTKPTGAVTRMKSHKPAHEAAAFYYPEWTHLPSIATVHFVKIKEYSNKDLTDMVHKELRRELSVSKKKQKIVKKLRERLQVTTKNSLEVLKDLEEDPVGTPRPNIPSNHVIVVTESPFKSTTPGEFGSRSADDVVLAVAQGKLLARGHHLPRHFRHRLHQAINRITEDDCLVSAWGEWSACSASCGIGYRLRVRNITREATPPRGRDCPELKDEEHCGVAGSCSSWEYFKWR